MKSQSKTILSLFILFMVSCFPLQAQISSSIVSPLNAASMADEVAFLYQAQLNIPAKQLAQFIEDHPVAISPLGNCEPPLPRISHQDNETIKFHWPATTGKKEVQWIRYLNMRTGEEGITSTTANTISLSLPNAPYVFMFQRECDGFGSNEYIIIDDKPISMTGGTGTDCICETSVSVGASDDFSGGLLSPWPSSESFVETYMIRVSTYFGESDFETAPDMYSSFSFHAFGGNGEVSLIQFRNDCAANVAHDLFSIFAIDESNADLQTNEGNDSPAFLQFTFADGISMESLGAFYNGKIRIRKCVDDNTKVSGRATTPPTGTLFSAKPQVSPNPSSGEVQLSYQLSKEEQVQVQLFDSYGQRLKILAEENQSAGLQQLTVDLSPFPVGTYYCRIQSATLAEGVWMIKQH